MMMKNKWLIVLCIALAVTATSCGGNGAEKTGGKNSPETAGTDTESNTLEEHNAFADLMIRTLREEGLEKKITYDPKEFSLLIGEGSDGMLSLANVYDEYKQADVNDQDEIVKRFAGIVLRSSRPLPKNIADARTHIFPQLRNMAYHSFMELQGRLKGIEYSLPPHKMLTFHFSIDLVYDWPESIQGIHQKDLDEWGITFEKALEIAKKNLEAISKDDFFQPPGFSGVFISPWQDSYDAARLILPNVIDRLQVTGDPVAAVPNRDTLIVTGSGDEEGLKKLVELASEELEKPRPLSGTVLRRTKNGWEPFLPGMDSPLFNKFMMMQTAVLAPDYQYQKELLDQLYRDVGADIFVAKYQVMRHEDNGSVISVCVWTRDQISLLPETSHITFFDDTLPANERVIGPVKWEDAFRIVGNKMIKQDLSPPRYKVEGFPSPEQLKEMMKQ
jgi:uncharacterized protein YtpQ (UPF0354 family)